MTLLTGCWTLPELFPPIEQLEKKITFPSSLREIGDSSFSDIPNLKKVVISKGTEKRMCKIPFGKINTYEQ